MDMLRWRKDFRLILTNTTSVNVSYLYHCLWVVCGHFRLHVQQLAFPYAPSLVPCQLPRLQVWSQLSGWVPCTLGPPALRLCLEALCQPVGGGAPGCLCGTLAKPPATCHLFSTLHCLQTGRTSFCFYHWQPPLTLNKSFRLAVQVLENVPSQTHYCPLGCFPSRQSKRKIFSNKRLRPPPISKVPLEECRPRITQYFTL